MFPNRYYSGAERRGDDHEKKGKKMHNKQREKGKIDRNGGEVGRPLSALAVEKVVKISVSKGVRTPYSLKGKSRKKETVYDVRPAEAECGTKKKHGLPARGKEL